ncbi:MAG TPA: GntR family transcriptional regulator [Candidatus Acidoferrales bacterium]|nr:GntR family transcriptional regulator [Candidatus Acidoferrales bacterium]
MHLWFARGSGVSLREQLVTQIVLGILSGDLTPGQRLPSTRELSRRFRLHPNTVSAGYRQLERCGWVELRCGSGIYVQSAKPDTLVSPEFAVEQLFANLFRSARMLNIPLAAVRSRLRQWLELQPPDRFLLVEPDEELRQILVLEIGRVVSLPVVGSHAKDPLFAQLLDGSIPLSLPGTAKMIGPSLLRGADPLVLSVNSVPKSLAPWLPAPTMSLIGIASRWPGLLKMARNVLAASGFRSESLLFRDARKAGWQRGLKRGCCRGLRFGNCGWAAESDPRYCISAFVRSCHKRSSPV